MATIVDYSGQKRSANAYPRLIVSPVNASTCCQTEMVRIGELEAEASHLYYYKRCLSCGFTVRNFLPRRAEIPHEYVPAVSEFSKLLMSATYGQYLE